MLIAGGCYLESCHYPSWSRLFGSGLRAALAVSSLSPKTSLITYASENIEADIRASLSPVGIGANVVRSSWEEGWFEWLHPFDLVTHGEPPEIANAPLQVTGDVVLRFGMQEGEAVVEGGRVVYDPQSPEPQEFSANGSKADELALILSPMELVHIAGATETSAATLDQSLVEVFQSSIPRPAVLLLKDGYGGARLYLSEDTYHNIPTYAAESFFKIGSGDVLAAAFTHFWGERRLPAHEAAILAARCVAYYVDGARLPLPSDITALPSAQTGSEPSKIRILNSPGFSMGALLLHTEMWLKRFKKEAVMAQFEPLHESDNLLPTLVLIDEHARLADIYELASHVSLAQYVVVFCQDPYLNSACSCFPAGVVTADFASALYHVLRGGRR